MTKRPHHLRPVNCPVVGQPIEQTALSRKPATGPKPPEQHLHSVLREAETFFDKGEFSKGVESLSHAVLVAATTGTQGMETHELIHRLRRIAGWGFPGGEAA